MIIVKYTAKPYSYFIKAPVLPIRRTILQHLDFLENPRPGILVVV